MREAASGRGRPDRRLAGLAGAGRRGGAPNPLGRRNRLPGGGRGPGSSRRTGEPGGPFGPAGAPGRRATADTAGPPRRQSRRGRAEDLAGVGRGLRGRTPPRRRASRCRRTGGRARFRGCERLSPGGRGNGRCERLGRSGWPEGASPGRGRRGRPGSRGRRRVDRAPAMAGDRGRRRPEFEVDGGAHRQPRHGRRHPGRRPPTPVPDRGPGHDVQRPRPQPPRLPGASRRARSGRAREGTGRR